MGGICQARRAGNFFCRALHFFGFTNTISRFGKRFRVVSTVWLLSCFLFFLLSVPPCPVICKSGGTCPRALDGVSVTSRGTVSHQKAAIQSECIASQGLFPILRSKLRTVWYFYLGSVTINQSRHTVWGARSSSASMARRLWPDLGWLQFSKYHVFGKRG